MSYVIGIDLGGSSVKATAVTPAGEILGQAAEAFDPDAKMEWAETTAAMVGRLQHGRAQAAARIGLSAPGLAARDERSIAFMPGRLQGLEGLDWTDYLGASEIVPVLNDAHAALLGEAWLGAARGFRNVIMLTLGTGVGGAAIVEGRLLRGHIGRAGHFGHLSLDIDGPPDVCGAPGSLEVMMGNCTVQERSGGRFQTTHELVAAHLGGDAEASAVWARSVRALACAIASLANALDPEAVIVGGGIALSGAALFEPLDEYLKEVEWKPAGHRVRILAATLGEFAGACGAAHYALSRSREILLPPP